MLRISSIRNSREASLEKRREELRNSRWARHRSQLLTFGGVASVSIAAVADWVPVDLARVIERFLGI
jgi:hypothetical protein